MDNLPKQISYQSIKPRGLSSQFKQWPVDPMSSNAYWQPNQIVRFLLMLSQGYMDPYRSYFQIQVEVDPALNIGGVQVDSSAQSFINQLVISSNSVQIQRIAEYDTIGCILTDLGFSEAVAEGRDLQGMGMSQWAASDSNRFARSDLQSYYAFSNSTVAEQQVGNNSTICPTRGFQNAVVGGLNVNWQQSGLWASMSGVSGSQASMSTPWNCNVGSTNLPLLNGYYANIRAQYISAVGDDKYPQAPLSIVKSDIQVQNALNSAQPYTISFPSTNTPINRSQQDQTCAIHGYNNAYSPYTTKGVFQPVISNVIPQSYMQNGLIVPTGIPVRKRTFLLPVLSAVVGVLIPPDQYKLLPLKALMNLLLQVTLNPYAMFSTGYQDRHQFDTAGISRPIPRAFRITRFQWILNLYSFNGQAIRNYMQNSLTRGIAITSTSWMLGSQYQIPNGQVIRNSWQVNSTAQSLAQLVIAFLPNDYQKYPFCRKQFRISNNITSFQLKFNTSYYPPQPILGNGGNPQPVNGDPDNMNFYLLLLKSNNFLFNINLPLPRINRVNFAINDRCYDPTDTRTYAPLNMSNTYSAFTTYTGNMFNANTAMGLPYFHQNRWVGKALYTYSFQPFAHSKEYTMGTDSRQARPFQVLLNTNSNNFFPRDQTMYIFLKHNVGVIYTKDGIMVTGR